MAILDVVGELFGFSDSKAWTLTGDDLEFNDLNFQGQFMAQNFRESGGDAELGESTTLNKEKPNFQFLSNDGETVTFQTRFYATDSFKNIKQQIELLRSLKKRDPDLKRPPKLLFTYGTETEFTCFVRRVDYLYDELRSDGSIRGVIASITLQKLDVTFIGSKAAATSLAAQIKAAAGVAAAAAGIAAQIKSKVDIPGASPHTVDRKKIVRQGETFESIAQREYGSALLGDVLRRAQPGKANLKVGDAIVLLDADEISEIEVTPQSVPLKATPNNQELRQEFLDLRKRKTTVFV